MNRPLLIALALTCSSLATSNMWAQQNNTYTPWDFRDTQLARRELLVYPLDKGAQESNFAAAITAARYYPSHNGLATIDRFIRAYPTDSRRDVLNLYRGSLYLHKGDFHRARHYLEQVDEKALTGDALAEWQVKLAFALLRTNRESGNLLFLFQNAAKSNGYWGRVANLYVAGELLAEGKIAEAKALYKSLELNPKLVREARIGAVACLYYEGDYKGVIKLGEELLNKREHAASSNPTLLQALGNARYRLGDSQGAVRPLETLFDQFPESVTPEDRVIYGAALMEKENYLQAKDVLRRATEGKGLTAEVATLYLSRSSRELKEYPDAIAAYEMITGSNITPAIREAAMYEMALVMRSTGQSNFGQDVRIAEQFLNSFPQSKYRATMEGFLSEFYLSNTDYDSSLKSIRRVKEKTPVIREAEQYVLNALAAKALKESNIKEGEQYLSLAMAKPRQSEHYYGESLLILSDLYQASNRIPRAIAALKEFIALPITVNADNKEEATYRLAYLYFNNRDFGNALNSFKQYSQRNAGSPSLRRGDAYARLGDCFYAMGNLEEALVSYNASTQLLAKSDAYPLVRKAEILGLQKKYGEQIAVLDNIIRAFSSDADRRKASLQKGQAYLLAGRTGDAEKSFLQTARLHSNSEEGRQASLRLALLYYNAGRTDAALQQYRDLIVQTPNSKEAKQAFENLKTISIEEGRTDILEQLANDKNSGLRLSYSEERAMSFGIARTAYRNKKQDAYDKLSDFIKKYRNGADVIEARFMNADILFASGAGEKAYQHYLFLEKDEQQLDSPQKALLYNRLGVLEMKEKAFSSAFQHYSAAYNELTDRDARIEAANNALLPALLGDMPKEGIALASKVLEEYDEAFTARIRLLRGDLYVQIKQTDKGLADYHEVAKNPDTPEGAEAVVREAETLYRESRNKSKAKTLLNRFIEKGTPQEYWLAKGIILLAEIHAEDNDKITAKQYLQSLLANYPQGRGDEITEQAEQALEKIEASSKPKATTHETDI